MTRIYPDYAYSDGPRQGCWWDETCIIGDWPMLQGDASTDVAIIGAGFTGLSAALHLAEAGVSVTVLEAETPGWGASGRNGGFCCVGGSKVSDAALERRFGHEARLAYRRAEVEAVEFVSVLVDRLGLNVDRHSDGETVLAHRAKDFDALKREAEEIAHTLETEPELIPKADLGTAGLAGPFHGALTIPIGFGLNPRKYLTGLLRAVVDAGGTVFGQSAVTDVSRQGDGYVLRTRNGRLLCKSVVIATNGYASESVPPSLAGRYLPTQSNVLVTRPLSDGELDVAGWTSEQMAYDTRNLLHYFRLMPDRRFLFGMRGGLISGPAAERRARSAVRRDFERMFPSWAHVETTHAWSGLVCLTRTGLPFVGQLEEGAPVFAGFGYHGNGVAMGSYAGAKLADLITGKIASKDLPRAMTERPARFPLGRFRRAVLPPVYAMKALTDW